MPWRSFQIPVGSSRRSNQVHLSGRIHNHWQKFWRHIVFDVCGAAGDLKLEGVTEVFTNGVVPKGTIRNTRYGHNAEFQLHDDGRKAAYTCDVGYAAREDHFWNTLRSHWASRPSAPKMLTIATCTHVHRTGRASNVNSHNCDCNPEFQETENDERRCVEILSILVVLFSKKP